MSTDPDDDDQDDDNNDPTDVEPVEVKWASEPTAASDDAPTDGDDEIKVRIAE